MTNLKTAPAALRSAVTLLMTAFALCAAMLMMGAAPAYATTSNVSTKAVGEGCNALPATTALHQGNDAYFNFSFESTKYYIADAKAVIWWPTGESIHTYSTKTTSHTVVIRTKERRSCYLKHEAIGDGTAAYYFKIKVATSMADAKAGKGTWYYYLGSGKTTSDPGTPTSKSSKAFRTVSVSAHKWTAATCTTPKTCTICKKTSGAKLGHTAANADGKCARCGSQIAAAVSKTPSTPGKSSTSTTTSKSTTTTAKTTASKPAAKKVAARTAWNAKKMTSAELKYAKKIFKKYNKYRKSKGLKKVKWSNSKAKMAFKSVTRCAQKRELIHGLGLTAKQHKKNSDILQYSSWKKTPAEAIDAWVRSNGHRVQMQCTSATKAAVACFWDSDSNLWYYAIVYNYTGTNVGGK